MAIEEVFVFEEEDYKILYLSLLCGFFGGGDMNGISLLVPEMTARIVYGIIFIMNLLLFKKGVLPKYKLAFR